MFRLEVIGRFPTVTETQTLGIDQNSPVWLPTNGESLNPKMSKMMRKLSEWFLNGYKMA